ncbi:transcriptional regulator [Prodigiosinella confusarubida]|uniref:Transcriptional regulator n=1 Tax=Serratia sp. (strain ATCC 39006) TaxID=104623 RepID=A0A2I5TDN3_SERS3|nr:helix-turn-helix domain-containing protein [Serratia sp. ATCC 39006]AUG98356.1 transcriptional regulator [Serratia sp. ATCC 39006]AUH02671.1 transcriptional regulator [Serratia sp. ATCC 39006]
MSQNKIKQLRTQLSITQRGLADMVGTSQQQIQRIETGKVAAKLGLAQAICAVLNKPLSAVFPDGDEVLKEFRTYRTQTDEALDRFAANGIEIDNGIWSVKLYLRGHQDPLWLPISAADKRRFFSYFQEKTDPEIERFFVFYSDQYCYALNTREVAFHQFLFEALTPIYGDGDEHGDEDFYYNVCITLENGGPVIGLSVESDEPEDENTGALGQLGGFFDMLESGPEKTARYVIADADGEDAFIRIGSIAMVKVALDVLEPVEDDDEEV